MLQLTVFLAMFLIASSHFDLNDLHYSCNYDASSCFKADFKSIEIPSVMKSSEPTFPTELDKIMLHGTTTISFINGESVIICVDSKASMGDFVGSRTVKKVFPISRSILATMAGGAADCAYWIRRVSHLKQFFEARYDSELGVGSVARLLSSSLREYKGAGLSVGTMVAGFDKTGPALYFVDSEGHCVPGSVFCVGSGATLAYSILDQPHNTISSRSKLESPGVGLKDMELDDAINTAMRAVRHATHRDGYSGGYINVLQVNSTGIFHLKRVECGNLPM